MNLRRLEVFGRDGKEGMEIGRFLNRGKNLMRLGASCRKRKFSETGRVLQRCKGDKENEKILQRLLCVVLHRFKMNNLIENLASCEILAVIRFLNAKKSYCSQNSSKIVWCLRAKCNE